MSPLRLVTVLMMMLVCIAGLARAEQFQAMDDYEIHYNVFNSSFIPPEVASAYAIQRGKYRALMNIAVLKKNNDEKVSENALITGSMKNLIGQVQNLDFTEIREGDSIYYIASFRFTDDELLMFDLKVQPNPNKPAYDLSFKQHFYAD